MLAWAIVSLLINSVMTIAVLIRLRYVRIIVLIPVLTASS
jgi:hypothetical protein